jgi:hypothetical protein
MQEKEDEAIREARKKETRQLETYQNQLLNTLNDAGLVKRIREE